jgi:hypothetical protein
MRTNSKHSHARLGQKVGHNGNPVSLLMPQCMPLGKDILILCKIWSAKGNLDKGASSPLLQGTFNLQLDQSQHGMSRWGIRTAVAVRAMAAGGIGIRRLRVAGERPWYRDFAVRSTMARCVNGISVRVTFPCVCRSVSSIQANFPSSHNRNCSI